MVPPSIVLLLLGRALGLEDGVGNPGSYLVWLTLETQVSQGELNYWRRDEWRMWRQSRLISVEAWGHNRSKPDPSPDLEFCLWENSRSRAGLGIAPTLKPLFVLP